MKTSTILERAAAFLYPGDFSPIGKDETYSIPVATRNASNLDRAAYILADITVAIASVCDDVDIYDFSAINADGEGTLGIEEQSLRFDLLIAEAEYQRSVGN